MNVYLKILFTIIVVAAAGYVIFYLADVLLAKKTPQNQNNQVCFKQNCFAVELAKNYAEQEKGLMNRTQLDSNKGMLFIFNSEGVYPFWMKNTLIPLDMIWMDANNKIVFIAQNVQPCKTLICPVTTPTGKAKYVLEINAGISSDIGLKVGDVATIETSN